MKKILGLLSTISLVATTSATVVACGFDMSGNDNGSGSTKPETPFNIKELSQSNESFDYVYNSKEQYLKASQYYIKQSINQGKSTYEYFEDGETTEKRADFSDFIFQSGAWYGNEGQWDLLRIDEIDGNYKYDEINIDSLNQNSYSKIWFQNRNKALKNYIDYYSGTADELKNGKNEIYYAYDGGMSKALLQYKNSKQYQIENPLLPGMEESLKKDLNWIISLTDFWNVRFNIIKKFSEKINDILVYWED